MSDHFPFDDPFERPPDALAAKIAALLDKAESTPYEAEAEAFLAKAQELMARHSIDEAVLAGARGDADAVETMDLLVTNPYATAKSVLLGSVAKANRCRVVSVDQPGGRQRCSVVGHRTDLRHVRTLYLSLSHQAVRFMLDATPPPGAGIRRFRHAFLLSYGARIGERLAEAGQAAEADAQAAQLDRPGGPSVSLVLAGRQAKVDRAFSEQYPDIRTRRISSSSGAGAASGRRAADRSALGGEGLGRGGGALPSG